jgi:agmatinase
MDDMRTKPTWSTMLHIGPATFLKAPEIPPIAKDLRDYGARAAVHGIPWDHCAIYRAGSSLGPKALRDASAQFISYHFEYDYDLMETYRLVDCGDTPVVLGNAAKTLEIASRNIIQILNARALPVVLGGNHLITVAGTTALSQHASGKCGFIMLDTHLDTAMDIGGEKLTHCSPVARTMELEKFDPKKSVIIGASGSMNPREEKEYVDKHGITSLTLRDVVSQGIEHVAKRAVEIAHDGTEAVYLSVDVDVLDGAYAPGTGTPTPGGMTSRELLKAINIIASSGIDAIDVVEVAPQYDISGITALVGCRVILDALASNAPNVQLTR